MTNNEHELRLSKLIIRELAITQTFHQALTAIFAALTVNDMGMIRRVLNSLGYVTSAACEGSHDQN